MPANPETRLLLLELVALLERTLSMHRTLSLPNSAQEADELRGLAALADDTLVRAHDALHEWEKPAPRLRPPLYYFGGAYPRSDLRTRMRARREAMAPMLTPKPEPTAAKVKRPEMRP